MVTICDGGLATSSPLGRGWQRGGVDLHHIVVPATGLPADSCWRAASVAAATCVDANIASTAAILRGEQAPGWLAGLGLPARLVRHDGSTVPSAGGPLGTERGTPHMSISLQGPGLWYATRATGLVTLVLLTASVLLGILNAGRFAARRWPRFLSQGLHRNLSLLVLVFLALHVGTTVIDTYTSIGLAAAFIPFVSSYKAAWLEPRRDSLDMILALVATSLLRARLGHRAWRRVHWGAYACWPVAVAHGAGHRHRPERHLGHRVDHFLCRLRARRGYLAAPRRSPTGGPVTTLTLPQARWPAPAVRLPRLLAGIGGQPTSLRGHERQHGPMPVLARGPSGSSTLWSARA